MSWSPKTKPTPANIRKRIDAALEALDAALDLVEPSSIKLGQKRLLRSNIDNAKAWAHGARGYAGGRR